MKQEIEILRKENSEMKMKNSNNRFNKKNINNNIAPIDKIDDEINDKQEVIINFHLFNFKSLSKINKRIEVLQKKEKDLLQSINKIENESINNQEEEYENFVVEKKKR